MGGIRRFPTVIIEVADSQSEADLHRKAQRILRFADIAYTITIDIGEYDKGKSRTLQSLVAKLYCQDDVRGMVPVLFHCVVVIGLCVMNVGTNECNNTNDCKRPMTCFTPRRLCVCPVRARHLILYGV